MFNPILPSWEYIPGGQAHVFGDRLYLFGAHDCFAADQPCVHDYVCWWAPVTDLSDWHFEGVMYRKEQDPDSESGQNLLSPDVVCGNDRRFYLFYTCSSRPHISVAVSEKPEGPYAYYGKLRYPDGTAVGSRAESPQLKDPCLLTDHSGRTFLYAVSESGHALACELEQDMLRLRTEPQPVFSEGSEAQNDTVSGIGAVRRLDNRFCLVYISGNGKEVRYAVSDEPDQGFRPCGTLLSGNRFDGVGVRVSIERVTDQWLLFYSRETDRSTCARQVCGERLTMLPDGSFRQAEITSIGLKGETLPGSGEYPAYMACQLRKDIHSPHDSEEPYFTQSGRDRERFPDQYIADMQDGAEAGFRFFRIDSISSVSVLLGGIGNGHLEIRFGDDTSIMIPVKKDHEDLKWFFAFPKEKLVLNDAHCSIVFVWRGTGRISFHNFRFEP